MVALYLVGLSLLSPFSMAKDNKVSYLIEFKLTEARCNIDAKSPYEGTEWYEFEKRDTEIISLSNEINEIRSKYNQLDVPATVAYIGRLLVTWQKSDRKKELRALQKRIKALKRQKKEYEELQEKTDTTKIWGSSILTYHNLNAEELTKIRKDNKINNGY